MISDMFILTVYPKRAFDALVQRHSSIAVEKPHSKHNLTAHFTTASNYDATATALIMDNGSQRVVLPLVEGSLTKRKYASQRKAHASI